MKESKSLAKFLSVTLAATTLCQSGFVRCEAHEEPSISTKVLGALAGISGFAAIGLTIGLVCKSNEAQKAKEKVQALEKEISELQDKIEQPQNYGISPDAYEKLKAKYAQLQDELKQAKKELAESNATHLQKLKEKENEISDLKDKLKNPTNYGISPLEYNHLKAALAKAEFDLAKLQLDLAKEQKNHQDTKNELTKAKIHAAEEAIRCSEHADDLKQANGQKEIKIINLEFELKKTNAELSDTKKSLESANGKLRKAISENAELSNNFRNLMLHGLSRKCVTLVSTSPKMKQHFDILKNYKETRQFTANDLFIVLNFLDKHGFLINYWLGDCKFIPFKGMGVNPIDVTAYHIANIILELRDSLGDVGEEQIQKDFLNALIGKRADFFDTYKNFFNNSPHA